MELLRLRTVDAFVAFDLDGCERSGGGTRMAPDVTENEAALLARAMTYKFGVLGLPIGGAKGAIRHSGNGRDEVMRRYCEEIRPLIAAGRFGTGPDLGTYESDFAPLRTVAGGIMSSSIDGVPFEDVLTGYGVVAAAEAALGPLGGRSIAVEGFGKVGGGVAREAVSRGGRVVAVSTVYGCAHDERGLDVSELLALREKTGDAFVLRFGSAPPEALFDVEADVLVPGARTGVVDAARASSLRARAVVPAANVAYAAGAVEVLRDRGIPALPDFVCNAAAVIGYVFAEPGKTHRDVMEGAATRIGDLVHTCMEHPDGPFAGGCAIAEEFLKSWRGPDGMPGGPPLAREW